MACCCSCVLIALGTLVAARFVFGVLVFLYKLVAPATNLSQYKSGYKGDDKSKDTWAVVTGGAGGIGSAFAHNLAKAGFNLVLFDRNYESLQELKKGLTEKYPNIEVLVEEVNFSPADPQVWSKIDEILKLLDVGILVNNVGVSSEIPGLLEQTPMDEVQRLIDVNVTATTMMTRLLAPRLSKRKRSLIITLTSFVSLVPVPMLAIYSASKRYCEHLMACVAAEYRGKIDVSCVGPWWVATAMTKIRRTSFRVISPNDVARGTLRLAGQFFFIDPYWFFLVLDVVVGSAPSFLVNMGCFKFLGMVRRTYLKKAAARAAQVKKD